MAYVPGVAASRLATFNHLNEQLPVVSDEMDDAARFRQQAEDARNHATRAYSQLDKEAWLRVAEEWLKLAVSAELRDRK